MKKTGLLLKSCVSNSITSEIGTFVNKNKSVTLWKRVCVNFSGNLRLFFKMKFKFIFENSHMVYL